MATKKLCGFGELFSLATTSSLLKHYKVLRTRMTYHLSSSFHSLESVVESLAVKGDAAGHKGQEGEIRDLEILQRSSNSFALRLGLLI